MYKIIIDVFLLLNLLKPTHTLKAAAITSFIIKGNNDVCSVFCVLPTVCPQHQSDENPVKEHKRSERRENILLFPFPLSPQQALKQACSCTLLVQTGKLLRVVSLRYITLHFIQALMGSGFIFQQRSHKACRK